MARSMVSDLLQSYAFWLLDAYPIEPLALPILTPLFGFSAITAPELTVETFNVAEGNWYFKKKIVKGGDVTNMVLERGVTWYDSDFWRWAIATLSGDLTNAKFQDFGMGPAIKIGGLTPRRSLMLVQFMARPTTTSPVAAALVETGLAASGAALSGAGQTGIAATTLTTALITGVGAVLQGLGIGPFEFAARIPAKAWMLHGSIPVRYKAGTDFDASSGNLSIQQLELAVEMMEEISLLG